MLTKYVSKEDYLGETVSVKVTTIEKELLKEQAKTAEKTMSKYLRDYLPINKNMVEVDDWSYHELYERAYNGDKSVAQVIEELLKNSL